MCVICVCEGMSFVKMSPRPEDGAGPLEFQEVVSRPTWMLGTKLGSSGRAGGALSHSVTSPAPKIVIISLILFTLH